MIEINLCIAGEKLSMIKKDQIFYMASTTDTPQKNSDGELQKKLKDTITLMGSY